ncbi:hypothetical protein ECP03047775_3704, partial [Escherichia coli P0304777.5]
NKIACAYYPDQEWHIMIAARAGLNVLKMKNNTKSVFL